jgi:hypothetical protein
MTDKEQARQKLAQTHYELEPGIIQIHSVFGSRAMESRAAEPIKLLEVNQHTIASGVIPLGFDPAPASGMFHHSIPTAEEMGRSASWQPMGPGMRPRP